MAETPRNPTHQAMSRKEFVRALAFLGAGFKFRTLDPVRLLRPQEPAQEPPRPTIAPPAHSVKRRG